MRLRYTRPKLNQPRQIECRKINSIKSRSIVEDRGPPQACKHSAKATAQFPQESPVLQAPAVADSSEGPVTPRARRTASLLQKLR